jgi:beta-phosphoglucomutase-like phosphatase (HAD superfamily)
MNFLSVLFLMMMGGFSVGLINTLQADDAKEISSQTAVKHIEAVIFDCDGTLIDNGIGYFLDWQHALQCQGHELNADEFWDFMHKNRLVGLPGADEIIVKYCCELVGRECANEIMKDKKTFSAKQHRTYEFPAIEPTVNFLHALAKEKEKLGLKLGLASANNKENILRVLKKTEPRQLF